MEITIMQAMVQSLAALQQLERLAEGTPLQGLAYSAGILVGEVVDVLSEMDAMANADNDSEEEN